MAKLDQSRSRFREISCTFVVGPVPLGQRGGSFSTLPCTGFLVGMSRRRSENLVQEGAHRGHRDSVRDRSANVARLSLSLSLFLSTTQVYSRSLFPGRRTGDHRLSFAAPFLAPATPVIKVPSPRPYGESRGDGGDGSTSPSFPDSFLCTVHTDTHFTDRIGLEHGNVGDDVGNHRVDRDAIGYLRSLQRNSIYSNLSGGIRTTRDSVNFLR